MFFAVGIWLESAKDGDSADTEASSAALACPGSNIPALSAFPTHKEQCMSSEQNLLDRPVANLGWRVTMAGLGINLALGVLYSWSIVRGGMVNADWGWTASQLSLPYSVACLVFCLVMVPAGRMQDKLGPRLVATIGGLLVGLGMLIAGFMGNSVLGYVLGFGVLAGAGIGFGYASATPPAVKWFPASKTGLIAGLVVSGFGLASVYIAPLETYLIKTYGIDVSVMILGVGFLVVVCGLAQLLVVPPKGYVPAGTPKPVAGGVWGRREDYSPSEMLKTWQFYALWFMYACGAGAGLMVISIAKSVGDSAQAGVTAVVALAIGNGAGRVLAGASSDKLGRKLTLGFFLLFQAAMVVLLSLAKPGSPLGSVIVVSSLCALVGMNYGSNLALFPTFTKDYYGLKNFGMNYGLVFTAWGVGGFMLALGAGKLKDVTGSFNFAYYAAAVLLIVAAVVTCLVTPPRAVGDADSA
jgi:OFA family oxalate/formate antiporter-like MFS transporter